MNQISIDPQVPSTAGAVGAPLRRAAARALILGFALITPATLIGCKQDEEAPPPLPTAAPAATPAPETALQIEEEPLAEDETKPDAPKGTGSGKSATSLKNCCSALRQSAKSAPPPNNGYFETAASICDGMVAAGNTQGAAAALQAALRGAGLPASCY